MKLDLAPVSTFLEPRHRKMVAAVTAFCGDRIAALPTVTTDRQARQQARDVLGLLGAAGLCRHAVPASYGGHPSAPDLRACCLIREILAATSPLADAVFALQCLGSMPLTLAGDETQRVEWLPRVAAGQAMTAFAMTEPEAGSDVAAIATRAARDGDGYRLHGRKTLISNAGIADLYVVFASTEPEAGRDGLTGFLVPAGTPGLRLGSPQVMSAPHPLGPLSFDGCYVPVAARLGREGDGFGLGMQALDRLRPTVAAAACGMAGRALAEALAWARERRQFGRPLAEFQLVQEKLAAMATELTAARLLTYRAAAAADAGEAAVTLAAAMAKAFATEAAQRIVDQSIQIVGGRAVLADHPLDHLYRSVRALRIYEGTTEIQHLIIARRLLREEV